MMTLLFKNKLDEFAEVCIRFGYVQGVGEKAGDERFDYYMKWAKELAIELQNTYNMRNEIEVVSNPYDKVSPCVKMFQD